MLVLTKPITPVALHSSMNAVFTQLLHTVARSQHNNYAVSINIASRRLCLILPHDSARQSIICQNSEADLRVADLQTRTLLHPKAYG